MKPEKLVILWLAIPPKNANTNNVKTSHRRVPAGFWAYSLWQRQTVGLGVLLDWIWGIGKEVGGHWSLSTATIEPANLQQ